MKNAYFNTMIEYAKSHCGAAHSVSIDQINSQTFTEYEDTCNAKETHRYGKYYNYDLDLEISLSKVKFGLDYAIHVLVHNCPQSKLSDELKEELLEMRRKISTIKDSHDLERRCKETWKLFKKAGILV